MYVNTRGAVRALGLHPNTLRKYADTGIIPYIRTPSGRRMYDVDAYLNKTSAAKPVCYCRVSSQKQRDDLQRQVESMRTRFPEAEIIQDIGSGLNFKRKGLSSILGRLLQGEKLTIMVTNRDRLARFGFDLISGIVELRGGRVVVLDKDVEQSPESELTEDLLAILHHFSCRMRGQRSHKNKKNSDLSDRTTKEDVSGMVRDFETRLQQINRSPADNGAAELDGVGEAGIE